MTAHKLIVMSVVNLVSIWGAVSSGTAGVSVSEYRLSRPGLVSAAVYDAKGRMVRTLHAGERRSAGTHRLTWDGLDRDGRPVPVGQYTWKVLRTPGFRAEYVTSLGINPDSAPHDRWVGNHGGAASVAVDASGMYAAAQITETAPVLLKQSLEGKQRDWTRSRGDVTKGRYQGGISLASDGQGRLFMLQQNGYLQVIDAAEGALEATWDVLPEDLTRKGESGPTRFFYKHGERVAGADMDARGDTIVVSYRDRDRVRWVSPKNGETVAEIEVARPTGVAVGPEGDVFVVSGRRVLRISAEGEQIPVIQEDLTAPRRLACDASTGELLVAERSPSSQVKRFSLEGELLRAYGRRGGRQEGAYRPGNFRGITDIAGDGDGGFLVAELKPAPRRIAHCNRAGEVLNQWYGGQPYYAWGEPDPRRPSHVWFNSGDWLTLASVDYASGDWRVLETWHVDELAGGLVDSRPGHHGRWWVLYHGDQRYLVSQGPPQVLMHKAGTLRPVSVIGSGNVKRASDMAGKGSEANSFRWVDRNGDGRPQADEFTFSASRDVPRGNWVTPNFAILQAGSGERQDRTEFVVLRTRPAWQKGLPVYPIGGEAGLKERVAGTFVEQGVGSRGSGAYRDRAGNYYGNFNDGRERHGTGWPTYWGGVSRLVKWDATGNERWAVGRHAIHGGLGNSPGSTPPGRLHVPINVIGDANDVVILADRVETLAMAWTRDGLYAGSFFDRRTDDGLPETVYKWWRTPDGKEAITTSDNAEGGRVIQDPDGSVFWFVQGRNSIPVYRIHGWKDWTRLEGDVSLAEPPRAAAREGTGIAVKFFNLKKINGQTLASSETEIGGRALTERVDSQVWYGSPRNSPGNDPVVDGFQHGPVYDWSRGVAGADMADGFAARWTGYIEAPLSEMFTFSVYARGGVRLWIDDRQRIFGWNETTTRWEADQISLQAGRRYPIQIDFYTTHERPACSLNWESPSLDRRRIPTEFLYPDPGPEVARKPDARPATRRIDAATFDGQSGNIEATDVRRAIRGLRQRALGKSGTWLGYRRLDFSPGVSRVFMEATGHPAGDGDYPVKLAFRLDSPDGPTIATVELTEDGPIDKTTELAKKVSGEHDLYIVNTTEEKWHFIRLYGFQFEQP